MNLQKHLRQCLVVLLFLANPSLGAANTISWDKAIETVSKKAEEYYDYAVKVGGTSWAGTMYNGYKFTEHKCAILGRMLGLHDEIRHIEEFEYPHLDSRSDPHELLVFSISLNNWVQAAKWSKSANQDQRINKWNLDCVGKFDIAPHLFLHSGNPNAEFEVQGNQLHVYGDIDVGFADRFLAVLKANPNITEVTLGSGGGSVYDALIAGQTIRKLGLSTTIYGNCYSACPLVFLGGKRRVVWAAPYRLGFHQIYTGEGVAIPFDDYLYTVIANYTIKMGANPRYVLAWMYSASPSEMYEAKPQELCDSSVATFVQRVCLAD